MNRVTPFYFHLGTPLAAVVRAAMLAVLLLYAPVTLCGAAGAGFASAGEEPDEAAQAGPLDSLDDRFLKIADVIPEFGGFFRGGDGVLFMYLTDPTREDIAVRAIEDNFGKDLVTAEGVQVLEGRYGFGDLTRWHEQLRPVLRIKGVAITDLDESGNRLTVGLESESAAREVQDELRYLGIPEDAINIEVTGEIHDLVTLRDRYRPVIGGLQVAFNCNSAGCGACTNGFNAVRAGVPGFVTNSHCTNRRGGVEQTVYWQPSPWVTSSRVGYEIADPAYWTGGSCPSGRRCRYSDSAFARFDSGVSFSRGRVARTTGLGSITISPTYPRFRVVGENGYPLVGETLNKIGRTTGWSQGRVSRTCVTSNVSNSDVTMVCQDFVTASHAGGDSGSPVFRIVTSPDRIRLYGVLWGGNSLGTEFVFSRFSQIERELGRLSTCDPALAGC